MFLLKQWSKLKFQVDLDLLLSNRRNITTSSVSCDNVIESLKANPFYERYSQRITELQKNSPEELLTRWETQKGSSDHKQKPNIEESNTFTSGVAKSRLPMSGTKKRVLSDIMKVDLIKNRTSEEIKEIWETFHKSRVGALSATIPSVVYNRIRNKMEKYPLFVLPVPRNRGYEFIVMQCCENEIHFTPLISYNAHRANAPECLTLVYYSELMNDKGIVLMRGDYDKTILDMFEARCLANQIQLYYGEENASRTQILETFTNNSNEFDTLDVIVALESLSL